MHNFRFSQRWGPKAFLGLHWAHAQPGHTHSPMHACGLLESPQCVRILQSPLWTSHSLAFPVKLVVYLLFAVTYSQPQAALMLNNCSWLFLTNAPGEKSLFSLGECQVRLKKQAEWVESSVEPLDRSDNDSLLETGLCRSSNCILSFPVAARLLLFPMIKGCWFSRLLQVWGVGRKERAGLNFLILLYSYQ